MLSMEPEKGNGKKRPAYPKASKAVGKTPSIPKASKAVGKMPSIPQGEQGSEKNVQHTQGEQGSGKNTQHTQGKQGLTFRGLNLIIPTKPTLSLQWGEDPPKPPS